MWTSHQGSGEHWQGSGDPLPVFYIMRYGMSGGQFGGHPRGRQRHYMQCMGEAGVCIEMCDAFVMEVSPVLSLAMHALSLTVATEVDFVRRF